MFLAHENTEIVQCCSGYTSIIEDWSTYAWFLPSTVPQIENQIAKKSNMGMLYVNCKWKKAEGTMRGHIEVYSIWLQGTERSLHTHWHITNFWRTWQNVKCLSGENELKTRKRSTKAETYLSLLVFLCL